MPTGAELFVTALLDLGIDRICTLVGDHLNEVLVEVQRHGLRFIGYSDSRRYAKMRTNSYCTPLIRTRIRHSIQRRSIES